uniref:Uncharacterized protein n=1 Tax=Anopheles merus TaxID=30066 RepID=A0A182UUC1_ANOME
MGLSIRTAVTSFELAGPINANRFGKPKLAGENWQQNRQEKPSSVQDLRTLPQGYACSMEVASGQRTTPTEATKQVTVASSGDGGSAPAGEQTNALLSKLGSSLFGATGSPQKVVTNIRGFLSNRLTSVSIPDTGSNNRRSCCDRATNRSLQFLTRPDADDEPLFT